MASVAAVCRSASYGRGKSEQAELMAAFDWNGDESIVLRTQPAVAVYPNNHGQIVIRQCDEYSDEDQIIVVNAESARTLVEAIMRELDDISPQLALPAPKAKSGAERTRAYRDRKRDAGCDADVTANVTENVTQRR